MPTDVRQGRRPKAPFHRLPHLDGSLPLDASCAAAGPDFGQIVFEQPVAVLRPGSVRDVAGISFDLTSLAAI